MKNLIILLILKFWDRILLVDKYREYTYKDLAFKITNLSTMLDVLKISNPHIALVGHNSFGWIIVYLTALIKGIPITLISPKYSDTQINSAINNSNSNILFSENIHTNTTKTPNILANVMYDSFGFDLVYLKWSEIKSCDKKIRKWEKLDSIPYGHIKENTFNSFKDDYEVPFITYIYSSGVENAPIAYPINQRTLIIATKGMVKALSKNKLRLKEILVTADFNFFPTVTFLAIMGVGGTIKLSRKIGIEENKAVIGPTQWYEDMWDDVAAFMKEKNRRWIERWYLTKWLNTIGLKYEFTKEFPNVDTFIILNDETHVRLKDNLKRIGYNVLSTYGTAQHGQLIAINGQLIKHMKIHINSPSPTKVSGVLKAYATVGEFSIAAQDTGDIASIGPNSELIIHGRQKSMIITESGYTIMPDKREKIIRAHELIKDAIVLKTPDKLIVLKIQFNEAVFSAENKTYGIGMNIANEIMDELNYNLPEEVQIDEVDIISNNDVIKNEQGKLRRFFYTPMT